MSLILECHKSFNAQGYYCMKEFFVPVLPATGRFTRHATGKNMVVPGMHSTTCWKAFGWRGPNSWNHIPEYLKDIRDLLNLRDFLVLKCLIDFKRVTMFFLHEYFLLSSLRTSITLPSLQISLL